MRLLHLTLKKKWFDMILSGEKTEEYREMKPYWNGRLNRDYDAVCFRNGYGKDKPEITIQLRGTIFIGFGIESWGAPLNPVWIIKLGKILSTRNIKTKE